MAKSSGILRNIAIAEGKSTYFTGIPCKRGHISERRVLGKVCLQCCKEVYHVADRDNYRDPANTFYRQFYSRRQQALKKGIPFTIDFEELEKPEFCPIFGIKLNYGCSPYIDGKQTRDPNKASIDKKISSLGYIPGNTFVISWKANIMKADMGIPDLEKILEYMRGNNNG